MTMPWLRRKSTGTQLTRMVRARWRLISLVSSALLMIIIGVVLPDIPAFVLGILVLGSSVPDARPHNATAAMVRAWSWLDEARASRR